MPASLAPMRRGSIASRPMPITSGRRCCGSCRRSRSSRCSTPAAGAVLEASWSELVGAARRLSSEAIAREYEALFGGVGKPEVYLFGSHYLSGFLNEKPLAALRTDLAGLGLARDEAMPETEDHFAYLCEVMRYLIAGDDVAVANLTRQREFFARHLQPWASDLCDAVGRHPKADFYRCASAFTQVFISVEAQGFDMLA